MFTFLTLYLCVISKANLLSVRNVLHHEDVRGSGGIVPLFLTSALEGGEWRASRPDRFTLGTHWIRGWVGPRAGLDTVEKKTPLSLPGIEPLPSSP
jgi:hypothetical protein